jgi:hypothetical protein
VVAGAATAADILFAINQDGSPNFDLNMPIGGAAFGVLATAMDIGLLDGDGIDALVLSRGTPNVPHLVQGLDEALFSLDPMSVSVLAGLAAPGDVYYTDFNRDFDPFTPWDLGGSLFASAASLGLAVMDNLDGLDIFVVPEPASLLMLAIALVGLSLRRCRVCAV